MYQKKDIYKEEKREYYEPQNMNQRKEVYQENIQRYNPQENLHQNEVVYHEKRQEFSHQTNNNINDNYIKHGSSFCPVHGLHHNKYRQNQGFETQKQIRQIESRNLLPQNQRIFHSHEEMDGIIGDTNNYKFYESKNIKNNNQGNLNFITLHYNRGDEKENNYVRDSSNSNVYFTTQTIPTVDSNYHTFSQSTTSYNNYKIVQSNSHSQGFCPVHGNKLVQIYQKQTKY